MAPDATVPKGPAKTTKDKDRAPVVPGSGTRPTNADRQDVSKRRVRDSAIARSPCTTQFFEECEAIVMYMARRGDIWKENPDLKEAYDKLVKQVTTCKGRQTTASEWEALAGAYADVTRFTYEMRDVNGRSVLDTWNADDVSEIPRYIPPILKPLFVRHRRPLLWAVLLSVAAIVLQVAAAGAERYYIRSCASELGGAAWLLHYTQLLMGWPTSMDPCVTEADVWTASLYRYVANNVINPLLVPAAWGGIGSCVFLMKRISDELFEFAYQKTRLQGYGSRICLGAILGVLVVQLFLANGDRSSIVTEVTLTPLTLAFVAGLAVKPVYAAFEAIVEFLTTRMPGRGEAKN